MIKKVRGKSREFNKLVFVIYVCIAIEFLWFYYFIISC